MKAIFLFTTALLYWYLMMAVHESGHVLAAWCTGGHVVRVVLHPLAISRTDVTPNPSPLAVVWGGPVWGSVLPVLIWLAWRGARLPGAKWIQGLAGFCLIANGLYVGLGIVIPAGDTEDMLRLGVTRWVLAATGLPAVAAGFWLWHRLGAAIGLAGLSADQLRRFTLLSLVGLGLVVGLMMAFSA